ncbi:hypothetical protein REPUB_Repub16aG0097800 [Reevesia pubescens]
MKAELGLMREEKICMEAMLIAMESAVEEIKRELSEYKALQKWTYDLLDKIISPLAGGDNVQDINGQNLDEETMKGLIEKATRDFSVEVLNESESRGRHLGDAENDGRRVGSTGDDHSKEVDESHGGNKGGTDGGHVGSTGDDHSKEAGGTHGGNKGATGGGHPEQGEWFCGQSCGLGVLFPKVCFIPGFLCFPCMDPRDAVADAILRFLEVEVGKERDMTRLMEESFMADRAALEAKERERSMLLREKDRILEVKKEKEKLVADFLEADGNKNFDDQKAMLDAIEALMSRVSGDGSNAGEFDGIYGAGGNINYLEKTQNLADEGDEMAAIEGINGGGGGGK